jgi:hypothetical protein
MRQKKKKQTAEEKASRIAKAALKRKAADKQEIGMKIILSLASTIHVLEKMGHKATRFPEFPAEQKEWIKQLETINKGIREWMNKTIEEE